MRVYIFYYLPTCSLTLLGAKVLMQKNLLVWVRSSANQAAIIRTDDVYVIYDSFVMAEVFFAVFFRVNRLIIISIFQQLVICSLLNWSGFLLYSRSPIVWTLMHFKLMDYSKLMTCIKLICLAMSLSIS